MAAFARTRGGLGWAAWRNRPLVAGIESVMSGVSRSLSTARKSFRASAGFFLVILVFLVAGTAGCREVGADGLDDRSAKDVPPPALGFDAASFRKPDAATLRSRLTRLQFAVTQEDATEPPFRNELWDEHRPGVFVDIVSGEPLFSSKHKFDSGTGWPSFTRPLVPENVVTSTDFKLILPRTEVRSKHADSHLGHVFDDGPPPTGKRYCMNSASLRFIPAGELAAAGYPELAALFATAAPPPAASGGVPPQ